MAKSKNQSANLIRSDKNLLAIGLFGAALLIAVLVFFDTRPINKSTQSAEIESERTYRVETAPASIINDEQDDTLYLEDEATIPEDISALEADYQ
ncbi:MAG: hypothetical protein M3Q44_02765 [bacterium]|nr:hypothetical protein [bacterium]